MTEAAEPIPSPAPPAPDPLGPALQALDRGDFVTAVAEAQRLSQDADAQVAGRARDLATDLRGDRAVWGTFAFTGALIVFLVLWYIVGGHRG